MTDTIQIQPESKEVEPSTDANVADASTAIDKSDTLLEDAHGKDGCFDVTKDNKNAASPPRSFPLKVSRSGCV
jgi:hypothetical protein